MLADSSLRPFACRLERLQQRGVAQLGSALRSGRRGRRFKSCHPDSKPKIPRPEGGGSSAFPSGTPEGPRRAGGSARRPSPQRDEPPRRAAGGGRGGDAPRRKPTERHAAKRWAAPTPSRCREAASNTPDAAKPRGSPSDAAKRWAASAMPSMPPMRRRRTSASPQVAFRPVPSIRCPSGSHFVPLSLANTGTNRDLDSLPQRHSRTNRDLDREHVPEQPLRAPPQLPSDTL